MMNLPVIYPMGAVTEKKDERMEQLWNDPNWWAERKYDGSRYLVRKENTVSVVSRQKSKKTGLPVDKTENVPHLVEFFEMALPDGTILDGEIITHENCSSNDVTSIMGSLPEEALAKQRERGLVKYVIFDILYYRGQSLMGFKYYERRKALETVHSKFLGGNSCVLLAPIYKTNKQETYFDIVDGGGEGVILKNVNGTYIPEKKPKDTWVKVKKYDTYDCVIMGFTEPTKEYTGKELETWHYWISPNGILHYRENELVSTLVDDLGYKPVTKPYYNGWVGAIRFGQYKNGELIEVGQTSGISDDDKHYIDMHKDELIGQVIEVGAMEQIKKTGALRHPRFLRWRDDKNAEDCILGEI